MEKTNKITTKSYFIHRMKDAGYNVDKLENVKYSKDDKRSFSIMVDKGGMAILITVYKDEIVNGNRRNGKIQFYDGGHNYNSHLPLRTDSMEVIWETMHYAGSTNKHWEYNARKPIYNTDGTYIQFDK